MPEVNLEHILPLQRELDEHPVYRDVRDVADLRIFMSHHVYSVWDFMSLVKYLQGRIAPAEVPWMPSGEAEIRYFINQLVLEEESDRLADAGNNPRYGSHFEFYLQAMTEIGADSEPVLEFLARVRRQGVQSALESDLIPEPSRRFSETTFCLVNEGKPHVVAAALALGRERVIPGMFRRLIEQMGIGPEQAPSFFRYLNRHIHLDQDYHGPMALRMLGSLCGDDPEKSEEAEAAAEEALCARIRFWDGVQDVIQASRG
jgi:hypothetical protein